MSTILELHTEITVPSMNFIYHPRIGRAGKGRVYPYLFKDESINDFQETLKTRFKLLVENFVFPSNQLIKGIVYLGVVGMPHHRFWERDISNTVKAVEDAIFSILPYDDAHVIISANKKVSVDVEFLYVLLGFVSHEECEDEVLSELVSLYKSREIIEGD